MQFLFNDIGREAAKLARRLWTITPHGTKAALQARDGRKYYQSKKDGTWWSVDTGRHGSSWRVFERRGDGLHWVMDADQYGSRITGKHKGPIGMFIPNKQLSSTSIPNSTITSALVVTVTVLEVIDPMTYITSGNNYSSVDLSK